MVLEAVTAAAATAVTSAAATAAAAPIAIEFSMAVIAEAAGVVVVVLVVVTVTKLAPVVAEEGAPTGVATEAAAVVFPNPSFSCLNSSHHSSASSCRVARTCLRAVAMSSLSYEPNARM